MCFDKNERRLVTAASNGSVVMWNFNNGSKLREYQHSEAKEEISTVSVRWGAWAGCSAAPVDTQFAGQPGREICTDLGGLEQQCSGPDPNPRVGALMIMHGLGAQVLFAADEKRESDAVYAAGWNGKVFVWQDDDQDNDVIKEYRCGGGGGIRPPCLRLHALRPGAALVWLVCAAVLAALAAALRRGGGLAAGRNRRCGVLCACCAGAGRTRATGRTSSTWQRSPTGRCAPRSGTHSRGH